MTFRRSNCRPGSIRRRAGMCCAALGLATALAAGCRTLSGQGPVPKPVAEARQLSQRGASAMERDDWSAAESLLGQAVKVCPDDIDARRQYAETLWHRGEYDLALKHTKQAMALAPDDCTLAVRAGEMHLALGQLDEAARLADAVLDVNPNEPGGWALRGRVEFATGQFDRALADFQHALEFRRDDRDLLLETAELYRRLNRPQRAMATLVALQETYGPGEEPQQVLYLQGLALHALARHDDAVDRFALALARGPASSEMLYFLAEAQFAAGRAGDAERSVVQALAIDPQHAASLALREQIGIASRSAAQPYR